MNQDARHYRKSLLVKSTIVITTIVITTIVISAEAAEQALIANACRELK